MSAPRAWNLTRSDAVYRHDAFSAGLRAAGFDVQSGEPRDPKPGDCLLIWNRYANWHSVAEAFERAGATVAVAENGYLAPGGISPHSMKDRSWYALARGFHNDSSVVRPGDGSRFNALSVELKPWRKHGNHILIAPNRVFGTPGRIMPNDWTSQTRKQLETLTKRPIRIRPHPGNDQARVPLADDLRDCWAVVIWYSSAGIQALVGGIPVIACAPNWICRKAALPLNEMGIEGLEHFEIKATICGSQNSERLADISRRNALCTMANSQFHMDEIASGFAFRSVLGI